MAESVVRKTVKLTVCFSRIGAAAANDESVLERLADRPDEREIAGLVPVGFFDSKLNSKRIQQIEETEWTAADDGVLPCCVLGNVKPVVGALARHNTGRIPDFG